jgi:putative addiction module killer protein
VNYGLQTVGYGIHLRCVRNHPLYNLRVRIAARIDRLAAGNPGDVEPVGSGVSELRIDYGPGYRVYFKRTGRFVIVLFCGGTKGTQDADIKRAIQMAKDWK